MSVYGKAAMCLDEFVPRVNESYSLLAIHRKWESANVRNVTRWRFAKLRTSRTAEFAVLGHTPGEVIVRFAARAAFDATARERRVRQNRKLPRIPQTVRRS
jgi:hypothetical protein